MSPSYAQNKPYIYNWIEKNKSRHNELSAQGMVRYRAKCKNWKEIQKVYFSILLDDVI